MQGQGDAGVLGHGQHLIEKIREVFPQLRGRGGLGWAAIGVRHIASNMGEVERGNPGTAAFNDLGTGALPVIVRHPVIAQHFHPGLGHITDDRFEICDLGIAAWLVVDHFQMRNSALQMGELHARRLHHALGFQKPGQVQSWITHHDFGNTHLGRELKIPLVQRIHDHGKFHRI